MSHHVPDEELVAKTKNTARYFTENRHVAWVLLVATMGWGVFGYLRMPKAKDPVIPVRVALAICAWPGVSAEKIEQLIVPKIEQKIAENPRLERIEATVRSSVAIITIVLAEGVKDSGKEFDDIKLKLDGIRDLPEGAGPIQFIKDFGDTATLLLTVASPKVNDVEISLRARAVQEALTAARKAHPGASRAAIVLSYPPAIEDGSLVRLAEGVLKDLVDAAHIADAQVVHGVGFVAIDAATSMEDDALLQAAIALAREKNRVNEIHPDVWRPVVIRDPIDTEERLGSVAGDRYSYRELDQLTETLQRHLTAVPLVSKVTRSGVLSEAVYLEYSQERLAGFGLQPAAIGEILAGRNITAPGGVSEIGGRNVAIDPSGSLANEDELAGMLATTTAAGVPVYLRELVDVRRDYLSPARYLNHVTLRDRNGEFVKVRAISLAVTMRPGSQIEDFATQVDARLTDVKRLFPEDLIIRRTSDQPLQVRENIDLFMSSLYEAIFLVVLVGLIGFWEWRSATLLALSIPITLAMTFGMMHLAGIDLQQISIASLILALGLLVDDPVVAGDAIKASIDEGWKPSIAAWLGPTKLATAILFATITNIVAYLPMLGLTGDIGNFIYSLPVVITCSLVASRLVSMTFIPLLGRALLKGTKKDKGPAKVGAIAAWYRTAIAWTIPNRGKVLIGAFLLVAAGFGSATQLKMAFFPTDLSYLSYVDVWLPEDAPLSTTREVTRQAEKIIQEVALQYGKDHPDEHGFPRTDVLTAVTTFVGGGSPRFWFSVHPEQAQLNYGQMIVHSKDRHDTSQLVPLIQRALSTRIAGAILDVRQLENGKPVGIPVSIRVSGDDPAQLRAQAEKVKALLRTLPSADRVRDDWGAETFSVKLEIDPDRANLAGVTNLDVARSSAAAMSGRAVGSLREGDRQIPIVARLRADERAQLEDIENLYVTSSRSSQKVPLRQISRVEYRLQTEKIRRRNQFRTVTISAFPVAGLLPSQVIKEATPGLTALTKALPPGYLLTIGGEQEARKAGFGQLAVVMIISVLAIFLALVIQFKSAVKPLVVFATIPFGVAGALAALVVMGAPFGFMAFLGIVSLIGVIVSHVIVKFEFIEEQQQKGVPLHEALVEAGTARLRPVLITVGATVLGLVPLALHGGPLWEPLCYAQMGGLMVATVLTLFLVPVLYTVAIEDLKLMKWALPDGGEVTSTQSAPRPDPSAARTMPVPRPQKPVEVLRLVKPEPPADEDETHLLPDPRKKKVEEDEDDEATVLEPKSPRRK